MLTRTDRTKRVAICVDDFGLHAGVNQAVLDLLQLGRISAVSCLVDGPSWAEAAPALKHAVHQKTDSGDRQADVGLHLNLTECLDPQAQAAWPSQPLGSLIRSAYLQRWDQVALQAEIARQWGRFVAIWGDIPDFVDGHQHVHQLPQVRQALMAVMANKLRHRPAPGATPWLRQCRAPVWGAVQHGVGWSDAIKAQVISTLGSAALARLAAKQGLRVSAHLLGVYPFDANRPAYLARWAAWLSAAQSAGDLVMCHPAKPGIDQAQVSDVIAASRFMEYDVLTSQDWSTILNQSNARVSRLA